jgi:hypothetical protein
MIYRCRRKLRVTAAALFHQAFPIGDDDVSSHIIDQPAFSHILRYACNARPINTQNASYMLLSQLETIYAAPVMKHEQPGRESLLDRVMRITRDPLRDLCYVGTYGTKKQAMDPIGAANFLSHGVALDLNGGSGCTNLHPICRSSLPKQRG